MGNSHIFVLYEEITIEKAVNAIRSIIEDGHAHLLHSDLRGGGSRPRYEFVIDTETGITSGEISQITKRIAVLLDEQNPEGDHEVIVSSPGLDRPLEHAWQYRRHAGRIIEIELVGTSEKTIVRGRIESADEEHLTLDCEGTMQQIPFHAIAQGIVQASLK